MPVHFEAKCTGILALLRNFIKTAQGAPVQLKLNAQAWPLCAVFYKQ